MYKMFIYIISIVCVLISLIFFALNNFVYKYWERKGVKGPKPKFLLGNTETIFKKEDSITSLTTKIYQEYPEEKYVGIYLGIRPALVIRDLELSRCVLIKEFGKFVNRGFNLTNEPLNQNLSIIDGDDWRILRQRLSPIFTFGKLKQMLPLLNNCIKDYVNYTNYIIDNKIQHEIRSLNMKYTLKGITSCAFGLDIDPFSNSKNIFLEMADKLFQPRKKQTLYAFMDNLCPGILAKLGLKLMPAELAEFSFNLVNTIVNEREGKPKVRKDFMDQMIEMKEEGIIKKNKEDGIAELEITETIMAAQAVSFFAAGFETTSGALTYLMYELALNPDIQEKCYKEIKSIMEKYKMELSLEALKELEYTSLVFDEALRKHPLAGALLRQCSESCELPGTKLKVNEGMKLFIPVPAIHYDPQYYEEPEKFDPERFRPENREKIPQGAYLPFGDGPRNCIGMRFAKVQSMLGIAHFIYNFKIEPNEKTVNKIRHDPLQLTLVCIDGIWLTLIRRKKV